MPYLNALVAERLTHEVDGVRRCARAALRAARHPATCVPSGGLRGRFEPSSVGGVATGSTEVANPIVRTRPGGENSTTCIALAEGRVGVMGLIP